MKICAIIIEDEEPARVLLKNFLSSYSEIEFAGEFAEMHLNTPEKPEKNRRFISHRV